MKLTLLSERGISDLTLPEKAVGRYWLRSRNRDGRLVDIASVEALRSTKAGDVDQWTVKSNRRFSVVDHDGNLLQSVPLEPLELYRIQSTKKDVRFTLFTEPVTDDRIQYNGYLLAEKKAKITIGRDEKNSICYINKFTSGRHAELSFSSDGIFIKDLGSTNNTYVNNRAVTERRLSVGDVVYIMGLRVIVTNNGLFLNNPDGNVKVNASELRKFQALLYGESILSDDDFEDLPLEYYYRAPRFKHDVSVYELKVDSPPANQDKDEMPMIMVIGPSVTMGMASIASGVFTVVNAIERGNVSSAIPSLVMCLSMLLGTLMWPLITKTYQKRLRKSKEKKRQETYTAYLDQLEKAISAEIAHQETLLCENDVNTDVCVEHILSPTPQIWERTPKHTDFLHIRLGCGMLPLKANIQYPERKFSVDRDNLTEMMYRFGEKKRWLERVPISLSLIKNFISGIYGDKSVLYSFAKELILQIITMHSYDEVKLVLLYDESRSDDFSFARWLPHTMNNERTVRYIATDSEEAKLLSSDLDTIIEYRKTLSDSRLADEKEYYVIMCMDKELASKAECVRRVLEHKDNIKFSVLSVFERLVDLPKECVAVAEVSEEGGRLTYINNEVEKVISFNMDVPQRIDIRRATRVLSNIYVDISGSNFTLPKKYTFFEMLDIGMIEHLNIADNWATNDPTKSLAAVVGVDRYGEPFRLDLHERAHGPHGLVAGMTGSGKSEFIISYILSMAVSYHPYEVAFILIDYKGGGMAKSFENIPHTAGVITNLDGNGIKRSLASMRSELHRRERIFRDTSAKHNVSNIDIYKYQRLYREGKVSEPLPHLFIISDEFAELKKEQPDFMTELTSTARVGRSLGVHLILATQKPGGVVDDQIRSNSRFKVCLKVQDSGDSQEMLGRPDAASLVDTGRFYLQVGYNELFEIGQSAWAGAPYYPSQKVIKDNDDAVSIVNTNGRIIAEANTNRYASFSDPPKQLDVITEYIAKYCEEENITRWKMWLDPISPMICVDELIKKYGSVHEKFELSPVVGELDDPAHQSQDILRVPITRDGNVIVYGSAGSGKAMFLNAMCYSLMREHSPEEVNIYIMDFGSETFTAFAESPFVGDVILSYETEKVNNLFKLMMGKIETRKKLLSQYGGSLPQYNASADTPEPNIVVIINNFAAFNELFEEKSGEISYLTREGTKYGIYFVLTCTGINNVRFALLQNFKLLYCLQMNNTDDYSSVVGKTDGLLPEKYMGRGIFRRDKDSLVEFQTARITSEASPIPVIRSFCKEFSARYAGKKAVGVPVLPEKVTEQFLLPYAKSGDLSKFPVGVKKSTLEISYFDFSASPVNLILSLEQEWREFINALGVLIVKSCVIKTMILSATENNSACPSNANFKICADLESCVGAINDIFETVLYRNNEYKDKLVAGETPPEYESVFVIIESIASIKTVLERFTSADVKRASDDTPFNRLQLAMAKCAKEYNVVFVVCESISSITPFTVEEWYKTHISPGNGIWVGSGISSQFRLTVNKKPPEYSVELSSDFGFVIGKSTATLIKLLQ